jgi:hypothetical protein
MYRAFVTERYQSRGEMKVRHHRVGVGFDSEKGGVDVIFPPGVSVSGKVHIRPERERTGGGDQWEEEPESGETGDGYRE